MGGARRLVGRSSIVCGCAPRTLLRSGFQFQLPLGRIAAHHEWNANGTGSIEWNKPKKATLERVPGTLYVQMRSGYRKYAYWRGRGWLPKGHALNCHVWHYLPFLGSCSIQWNQVPLNGTRADIRVLLSAVCTSTSYLNLCTCTQYGLAVACRPVGPP